MILKIKKTTWMSFCFFECCTEAYPEPCQNSKMKCFSKNVYGWQLLPISAEHFILDVLRRCEYAQVWISLEMTPAFSCVKVKLWARSSMQKPGVLNQNASLIKKQMKTLLFVILYSLNRTSGLHFQYPCIKSFSY